jgi:glycerol-3-phosphate dehydrogenase (NAD+)
MTKRFVFPRFSSVVNALTQSRRSYQSHRSLVSPPLEKKPNHLLNELKNKVKVGVIGGGNWGSSVARKVGFNVSQLDSSIIDPVVKMWVREETVNGQNLTEIINNTRENVKYLRGIYIPQNVIAIPDLLEVVRDSNVLLFVLPHAFLPAILQQIKDHVSPSTICVSFIKGVQVTTEGKLIRYSEVIQKELGVSNVAVVMGANVAKDIAQDSFAETTVAALDEEVRRIVAGLFHSDTFRAQTTDDISTVELCGALKNVVALGAGKKNNVFLLFQL